MPRAAFCYLLLRSTEYLFYHTPSAHVAPLTLALTNPITIGETLPQTRRRNQYPKDELTLTTPPPMSNLPCAFSPSSRRHPTPPHASAPRSSRWRSIRTTTTKKTKTKNNSSCVRAERARSCPTAAAPSAACRKTVEAARSARTATAGAGAGESRRRRRRRGIGGAWTAAGSARRRRLTCCWRPRNRWPRR